MPPTSPPQTPASAAPRSSRPAPSAVAAALVVLLVGLLCIAVLAVLVVTWLRRPDPGPVLPPNYRCVARTNDHATAITVEQAWWTSIVVGVSIKRGLPARAASIAMATVYQETDIRNLDYGDRDSIGLFQQRPSQGWGTVQQIMDPYYSTGKFYDALVKVPNWDTRDITEVAQAVQRSGFPDAYRDHELDGRTLASTMTGWTPAGLTCMRPDQSGDISGLQGFLTKTLAVKAGTVSGEAVSGQTLTVTVANDRLAWAVAHTAIATGSQFGTVEVRVGGQKWNHSSTSLPVWGPDETPTPARHVVITVAPAG